MKQIKTGIRYFALMTVSAVFLLTTLSCQSSDSIMEEESLTGIYEIRSSGLFSKSYTFAGYTISDIVTSGKPLKSVLRLDDATKTTTSSAMSFSMNDKMGFKWSGIGSTESEAVSLGKNSRTTYTLNYGFQLSESQTGRVLKYKISYNPGTEDFDGFMKGTVVDSEGTGLFDVYSSKNLDYTASPADGLEGFTIRKDNTVLSTVLRNRGKWSVTFNIAEDDPLRADIAAVISSLYVVIEEGKV
ncbi:MAG: hypothetical protein PQJ58_13195 [Spirochaetales bacterium]|nr:hypothetical protein [Spirochaetales bacterium]